MTLSQLCILGAAACYTVATIDFARRGQWLLAAGWFTTVVSVVVWSFVKKL